MDACDQSRAPSAAAAAAATSKFVSRGFVRNKADKLMLIQGGSETFGATGLMTDGATALKADPQQFRNDIREAAVDPLDDLDWKAASTSAKSAPGLDKRAEARMKGYVGESCPECANFTLVRNGTCLKCDTCGSTTGCS